MEIDKRDKKKKNPKDKVFLIGKNYIGIEKLGKGTYGSVYKVQKKDSHDYFAIKKIKLDVDTEGIPSTALREIAILKKMHHPNIVSLMGINLSDKKIELCLEYCPHDLKKFMDEHKDNSKNYNEAVIKTIMYQILKATDLLHSKKILHRDLKPQNILISGSNLVTKIADFGLSRVYSMPIRPYTKEVLTLWYRAPELMLGLNHYSTGIDIWSVGCILAELYLKRPLFPGDAEVDQLFRFFRVFGTPNETTLPGFKSFPDYNKEFPYWKGEGLDNYLKTHRVEDKNPIIMDKHAFNLLERMLVYDPCKRISAKEALTHVKYIYLFLALFQGCSYSLQL